MFAALLLAAALIPANPSRVTEIEFLLPERPLLPCPPPSDRTAWRVLVEDKGAGRMLKAAEQIEKEAPPDLPDDLYLEFSRNGNRSHYERPYFHRLHRLQTLTLAECLEGKGRFLPSVRRDLTTILDERLWNLPAHDRSLAAFDKGRINVDLFAAERAWGVALAVRLLEGRLGDELEKRALARVRERVVDPYLATARGKVKPNFYAMGWASCNHNWNRVCHAGCCCAALLTCETRHERAEAIEFAERTLPFYLAGFSADGYCEEGIGYWNYGFGNHILLGLAVRRATGGKVDFFADPKNMAVATSPVRIALDETRLSPLFADAVGRPDPILMDLCARIWPGRIPVGFYAAAKTFSEVGSSHSPFIAALVERAFSAAPARSEQPTALPLRDWFDDAKILVSRLDGTGFSVALKPLNRGLNHHHADAGSYVLTEDGALLAGDCGGEQYTSRTFSSHRYDSPILNSYGHPVPVVDGRLQRTDRGNTKILSTAFTPDRDTLSVDLAPAYPTAKALTALVRTYVFDRAARTFSVTDSVTFSQPSRFETALVTTQPDRLKDRFALDVRGGAWTNVTEVLPNPGRKPPTRLGIRFTEPVTAATVTVTFRARPRRIFPKSVYLDLMERAVLAYSSERAKAFTDRNDLDGVKEHGFPRLTANLGILIAHGRQTERKDEFRRMMDICCRDVQRKMPPGTGGGNDFSVKELVYAVTDLEQAKTFPKEVTDAWRKRITGCVARQIYSCQPPSGYPKAHNWCVFGAASEQARIRFGMGGEATFVEKYLSDQLRFFDENGLYKDPAQPMVYDFVTRLQFVAALTDGYDGPSRKRLETILEKAALPTLQMQSVTGEIPFGGRSNQFLHNEMFYSALCEGYASAARRKGDLPLARRFRSAARRAVDSLGFWLNHPEVHHVKNRFPIDSGIGCEGYAYFDKYMVTMASWANLAFRLADETIDLADRPEKDSTFALSDPFHRVVANVGPYTAQFDWNAQEGYDANGLGRFQRKGAPPFLALSSPFPIKPHYRLSVTNDRPLAIAPIDWKGGRPKVARNGKVVFEQEGRKWENVLSSKGLKMTLSGKGLQTLTLPAFLTDGERNSKRDATERELTVKFGGWRFRCQTNGKIVDTGKTYGNRNGLYRRYDVTGEGCVSLTLSLIR